MGSSLLIAQLLMASAWPSLAPFQETAQPSASQPSTGFGEEGFLIDGGLPLTMTLGAGGMGVGSLAVGGLTFSEFEEDGSLQPAFRPSRTSVLDSCSTIQMRLSGCGDARKWDDGREEFGELAPLPTTSGPSLEEIRLPQGQASDTEAGDYKQLRMSVQIPRIHEWEWLSIKDGVIGIPLDALGLSGEAGRTPSYGIPTGETTRLEVHRKTLGLTIRF